MELTDWIFVGRNIPWVVGLACLLASLSWASWLAAGTGKRLRDTTVTPGIQACLCLGLALVSAGLLLSARMVSERFLWLVFLFWFAARTLVAVRARRRTSARMAEVSLANPAPHIDHSAWPLHRAAQWVVRAEPWLLLALTPFLMFPNRFTPWLAPLLVLPWLARKLMQGRFTVRTPLDGPILILLLMLPVSLWASMDVQRSMPKLYGILLGVAVFYALVNHVQRAFQAWCAGLGIALGGVGVTALALIGTDWMATDAFALPLAYRHLPEMLTEMGGSLGGGFNPNEVAAALALFIPFVGSLLLLGVFQHWSLSTDQFAARDAGVIPVWARGWVLPSLLAVGLLLMIGTLALTQSRSAILGTGVALLLLASFRRRWLRPALLLALVVAALAWHYVEPQAILDSILTVGTEGMVATRFDIWQRALYMIQDFPYTGVGLNTYSQTANNLYPFFTILPEKVLRLTHAHNVFLQVAVDLGLPGLVAYLALLMGFGAAWWSAYRRLALGPLRALAVGLLCSMVAYHVYGIADCLTLGAKPGVVIWAMWGLMAALANLSVRA